MKCLNTYKHETLGEIYYLEDEVQNTKCWVKKEKVKIFGQVYDLIIALDFYMFDKMFRVDEDRKRRALQIEKLIAKYYSIFKEEISLIELAMLRFYNEKNQDKLNKVIDVKEVWIFSDGYGVLVKRDISNNQMVILKRGINGNEYMLGDINYIDILPEWEVERPRANG